MSSYNLIHIILIFAATMEWNGGMSSVNNHTVFIQRKVTKTTNTSIQQM